MNVTATSQPESVALIEDTFPLLMGTVCTELGPRSGTSIVSVSSSDSTVTVVPGPSTFMKPISYTSSTSNEKSNVMMLPAQSFSTGTISTLPCGSQFAPSFAGAPPSPTPGPDGEHSSFGLPRAGISMVSDEEFSRHGKTESSSLLADTVTP
jgi:hypothetical protein